MEKLIEHIRKLNEGMVFQLVDTPEHWRSYGIETVEQFDRYNLECTFSEVWKGCYGVRHRGSLDHFTNEELESMIKDLEQQQLFDEVL